MKFFVFLLCFLLFLGTLSAADTDVPMSQESMDQVMTTAQTEGVAPAVQRVESEGVNPDEFDQVLMDAGRSNDAIVWNSLMSGGGEGGGEETDPSDLPGSGTRPTIPPPGS